jgi:cytochrome c
MRIMTIFCGIALAVVTLATQAATQADKAWAIAQKAGCTKCHAIDRAKVGPAWQDLHMKYRGDAGAQVRVSAKLKDAGLDHPELAVRPKDIDVLIPWIVAGPEKSPGAYRKGYSRAEKAGCTKCHAVDSKKVGPAWKDVAAKYKTDRGAEARLDEKLKNAGDDHPEIKIGERDRKTLVPWVLSL